MLIREVLPEEKEQSNQLATHPLQSWEWGEFREKTGKRVIRLGVFDGKELKAGYQLTVHPIPGTNFTILYFPRGPMPDKTMLNALTKLGKQEKAILVKMEPDVKSALNENLKLTAHKEIHDFLIKNGCRKGKPFFFEYTFQIDLSKSEKEILAAMHHKTRYNIRLSQRHGVEVVEDNSDKAFEIYLKLMTETTKRQHFYAHTLDYHQKMWQTLNPAGIARLLLAHYKGKVLAAYIFFSFNNILYYPYGGSSREHKEVMPTYAMMWETIKFGKKTGCKIFDLWGCLGPNPDPRDPWYGFHRFKAGFGGKLIEFIGTYDLIINPQLYPFYNLANEIRWQFLKLKTRLPF